MKNYNSEIILYAKGWYEGTDLISDLKLICGKRSGCNPEHISENDIINTLLYIIEEHKNIDMRFFVNFIDAINPNSFIRKLWNNTEYNFNKAVIEKCLSVINLMQVRSEDGTTVLIEIDPIDSFESVLPRKIFEGN